MEPLRHILITGPPGCGKTTLLTRLARRFAYLPPAGFYTEEIRAAGMREGFRLASFDGRDGLLAHVRSGSRQRVGRYGVDVGGFENFLNELRLGETDSPLILVDEIGKMECFSRVFIALVRELLDSEKMLVATVSLKGGGFVNEIKRREDCNLVKLSPSTRDEQELILARLVEDGLKELL